MYLNLISTTIENSGFKRKKELLELGLNLKYMILPQEIEIVPLDLRIINNEMIIIFGIKTHSFLYANVYKNYIESFLFRYFIGKYNIKVEFTGI